MGAPELPSDPGEDLRNSGVIHNPPASSDDSDNDSLQDGIYDGYQPLSMEENYTDYGYVRSDDNDYNNRDDINIVVNENDFVQTFRGETNIPPIEAADVEIERHVWNQPRPQELEIELDSSKTQQVNILFADINIQIIFRYIEQEKRIEIKAESLFKEFFFPSIR